MVVWVFTGIDKNYKFLLLGHEFEACVLSECICSHESFSRSFLSLLLSFSYCALNLFPHVYSKRKKKRTKSLFLIIIYQDFPFNKKIISSSRTVKILFLSFTCEDIGVVVVTKKIGRKQK